MYTRHPAFSQEMDSSSSSKGGTWSSPVSISSFSIWCRPQLFLAHLLLKDCIVTAAVSVFLRSIHDIHTCIRIIWCGVVWDDKLRRQTLFQCMDSTSNMTAVPPPPTPSPTPLPCKILWTRIYRTPGVVWYWYWRWRWWCYVHICILDV